MPTLNWIGKEAVVNHHRQVPYRLLHCDKSKSAGDPDSGNLLVQGDNLEALKALLPYYAGKVKCIYIDPPYNTGNENWIYNDNVNSPAIRKWLGEVVGKEAEDLTRHDKWLCMMYPRLALLREFLSDDGAIFVSMDDNAIPLLRLLMDELFVPMNFVANIVWQKKYAAKSDSKLFSDSHDYIVCLARLIPKLVIKRLRKTDEQNKRYVNKDNDPRGPWKAENVLRTEARDYAIYAVKSPDGSEHWPPANASWRYTKEKMIELIADNRIWFGKNKNTRPAEKRFLSEVSDSMPPTTWWNYVEVGHNDEAKRELQHIWRERRSFLDTEADATSQARCRDRL